MSNSVEYRYAEAVAIYGSTRLSLKEICNRTQISFKAFSCYLCRNHRDLILKRHNLEGLRNVKLRGTKGQSTAARLKYREAILAADSAEYIEYNISQIARLFGVTGTGLANQLRHHYPDIIPRREKERHRLGINDNVHHGMRPWCKEGYAKAVETLRATDHTIEEAAAQCNVTVTGLREHIACYHQDLVNVREKKRRQAMRKEKVRGMRTGAWTIHEPTEKITEKYAEAVELYRTTAMHIEDIAARCGVNEVGLGAHLRQWYPELIVERRGFDRSTNLSDTKRYKKATAEKYAEAIKLLKESDKSVQSVAEEYGFQPEVFRMYLKEHEPELVRIRGMKTTENGKRVGVRSSGKYAEALCLYGTSTESLKSIAERLGLVYISLGNYVRRNFPELIEQHNALLEPSAERFAPGIEMLRTSHKTVGAVLKELGYSEYFRQYVKTHHPELLERKTVVNTCKRMPAKVRKYAEAIHLLDTTSDTMKDIAESLGINYSSLRKYMYKHHPEILKQRGGNRGKS